MNLKYTLSGVFITLSVFGIHGCNESNTDVTVASTSSKTQSSLNSLSSSSESTEPNRLTWFHTEEYNTIKNDSATYEINPDFDNCYSGVLNNVHKERYLSLINAIRKLHDLQPLSYDYSYDQAVMDAALVMTIAGKLTHHPDDTWQCFSDSAYLGASKSNIAGGYKNYHDATVAWMKDASSSTLGHRRWILTPNITNTAIGDTGYYAQKVIQTRVPFDGPEFVAFPYKEYPLFLVQPKSTYSFTKTDIKWTFSLSNERGDVFDGATVNVNGELMQTDVDYSWYGIPNAIIWTVLNVEPNKKYHVEVSTKYGTYTYYVILK